MADFVPIFALSVFGVRKGLDRNPVRMLLIIRRPYAHLEDRLRRAFEGREDVAVIVDRRRGDRRRSSRPVAEERRRADRRAQKENIMEVVIEGHGG